MLYDVVWSWYSLAQGFFFFYQIPSFALLTTMSSEKRQCRSFLYLAMASAQFFTIIIQEHLVILGRFLIAVTKFQDKFAGYCKKSPIS